RAIIFPAKESLNFRKRTATPPIFISTCQPTASSKRVFLSAKTLILIDDEISTGNTFINLIRAYRVFNPKLEQVFIVSILNFTDQMRQREIAQQAGLPVRFVYALEGCLSFTPDLAYEFNASVNVTGSGKCKQALVSSCFGRLGLCGKLSLDLAALDPFIACW